MLRLLTKSLCTGYRHLLPFLITSAPQLESSLKCAVCVHVVQYVQGKIGSDRSQAKVEELLRKACNKIPIGKSVCMEFVPKIAAKLTQYLSQKLSPSRICQLLKLCNDNVAMTENEVALEEQLVAYVM